MMAPSELEKTWDRSTEELRQTMLMFAERQKDDLRKEWIGILKRRFGEDYDRPYIPPRRLAEEHKKTQELQGTRESSEDDRLLRENSMVPLSHFVEHLAGNASGKSQTFENQVLDIPLNKSVEQLVESRHQAAPTFKNFVEQDQKDSCELRSWVSKSPFSRQSQFLKWISVKQQFHRARFKRRGKRDYRYLVFPLSFCTQSPINPWYLGVDSFSLAEINQVHENQNAKVQRTLVKQPYHRVRIRSPMKDPAIITSPCEPERSDVKLAAASKSYVWVNPKSPRASQLRRRSYDSRYSSLIKLAESLDTCGPNEADVGDVITGFGGKLFEQDVVVTLNNMTNPETAPLVLNNLMETMKPSREVILYNVTMKVFRKNKDLKKSEKLFGEMLERRVKSDNATFTTIISCARQYGLPKRVVEWFEKMPLLGCELNNITLAAMIDAYGRGNVEMALSLYDRARTEKWRIDPVTFSTLSRVYGVSGNYDGCLNIYEKMKVLGVKPNLVIYNMLLDSMGRAKRPWQAKIIHKDLISNGFTPSCITYAALIIAYGRARYGDNAHVIDREMKEKGMSLTVILYNTHLSMCADIGYVDEAFENFQDMKVYCGSGRVSEAETALLQMREAGFEPTLFVLTSVIQCYGTAKQVGDVVRTFDQVLELGITLDDRLCGCLLNVMTQTPSEDIGKLSGYVKKAKPKLGQVVKMLFEELNYEEGVFKKEASELIDPIGYDVKKAYLNCIFELLKVSPQRASKGIDRGISGHKGKKKAKDAHVDSLIIESKAFLSGVVAKKKLIQWNNTAEATKVIQRSEILETTQGCYLLLFLKRHKLTDQYKEVLVMSDGSPFIPKLLEQDFFEFLKWEKDINALEILRTEMVSLGVNKKRAHELDAEGNLLEASIHCGNKKNNMVVVKRRETIGMQWGKMVVKLREDDSTRVTTGSQLEDKLDLQDRSIDKLRWPIVCMRRRQRTKGWGSRMKSKKNEVGKWLCMRDSEGKGGFTIFNKISVVV